MKLAKFFEELRSDVVALNRALPSNLREGKVSGPPTLASRLVNVERHLALLIGQARATQDRRTRSVIRSSWKEVSEFGAEIGLFERFRYQGDLKRELLEFLNKA